MWLGRSVGACGNEGCKQANRQSDRFHQPSPHSKTHPPHRFAPALAATPNNNNNQHGTNPTSASG